jgi:hypothetical protein
MEGRSRLGQCILLVVMAFISAVWIGWGFLVWGTMANWQWNFAIGAAFGTVAPVLFFWKAYWLMWNGLAAFRWAVLLCGIVSAFVIFSFGLNAARPLPDAQEQANWEAEFGWIPPVAYSSVAAIVAVSGLIFLSPVSYFLKERRELAEELAERSQPSTLEQK